MNNKQNKEKIKKQISIKKNNSIYTEETQILYIYDIEAKNKLQYNRIKRLFYYHLNKIALKAHYWKTKSTIAVPSNFEKTLDIFFRRFSKYVVVYKAYTDAIEKL